MSNTILNKYEVLLNQDTEIIYNTLVDLYQDFNRGILSAETDLLKARLNQEQIQKVLTLKDIVYDSLFIDQHSDLKDQEYIFNSPDKVGRFLYKELAYASREHFYVLFLNVKLKLIDKFLLSKGTINNCLVSNRNIIRMAMALNAKAVILAHNHPSGDPTPSDLDLKLTDKIKNALEILDIQYLDHIILGKDKKVYSLSKKETVIL